MHGSSYPPDTHVRFVDSHSHLADPAFDADRETVIERAIGAGASIVVCIGASLEDAARARELAARYPLLRWTAGLHPQDAARFDATTDLPALEKLLDAGAVAVGECGLDFHYDNAPRPKQHESFEAQLSIAAERSLPVIVHTRDATCFENLFLGSARPCERDVLFDGAVE